MFFISELKPHFNFIQIIVLTANCIKDPSFSIKHNRTGPVIEASLKEPHVYGLKKRERERAFYIVYFIHLSLSSFILLLFFVSFFLLPPNTLNPYDLDLLFDFVTAA